MIGAVGQVCYRPPLGLVLRDVARHFIDNLPTENVVDPNGYTLPVATRHHYGGRFPGTELIHLDIEIP